MKLSSSILLLLGLLLAAAASASLLEVRSTVRNAGDDDSDSDEDDGKVEFTVPAVDKDPEALDPKDMRDDPEPLLTMSKESSVACKNAGITADVGLLFGKDPLDKTQCKCRRLCLQLPLGLRPAQSFGEGERCRRNFTHVLSVARALVHTASFATASQAFAVWSWTPTTRLPSTA